MSDLILPEVPEVEQFFSGIRDLENINVDGYYRVKRKNLPVYAGGVDNLESAEQIDLSQDITGPKEANPDFERVYFLHYRNQVPQSIVELAFENIPAHIERIIFKVSRNFDVLIDKAGNLIFLKNRSRGFIQQDLVTHLLQMQDTYRLPGEVFRKFFTQFEVIGEQLATKLSTDSNVAQYYQKLLTEN